MSILNLFNLGSFGGGVYEPPPLPEGTVLLFDRTSLDQTIPDGFTLYTEESGGTIVDYLIKGGTSVSRNTGVSASVSISPQTLPTSSSGGHVLGPQISFRAGGASTSGLPGENPSGSHSHSITVTSRSSTFPVTGSDQGTNVPLIKCTSQVNKIPANCIVFSGISSIFSNFSRKSWSSVPLGVYSVSSSINNSYPAPFDITPSFPIPTTFTIASSGAHFHPSSFNEPTTTPGGPTINSPVSAGAHSDNHTVTMGSIYVWKQFVHLLPMSSSTDQFVKSGMIVMFSGTTVPSGWKLCDGTNGTPNMVDKFLGYNNSSSSFNQTVGADTVGSSFPTSTTNPSPPAQFRQIAVPISLSTFPWPHSHAASPGPSPAPRTAQHATAPMPHSHSVPGGMTVALPTTYTPAHITLLFIQKE